MGCKAWGLRISEANALRWIMLRRQEQQQTLLAYDTETRQWLLNDRDYPGKRMALAYVRSMQISIQEWRSAWEATRSQWAGQELSVR